MSAAYAGRIRGLECTRVVNQGGPDFGVGMVGAGIQRERGGGGKGNLAEIVPGSDECEKCSNPALGCRKVV